MPSALDRFIPKPDVRERFETRINAPAPLVLEEAVRFDLYSVRSVRAIFWLRERLLRAPAAPARKPQGLLEEMRALGWGVLERTPERIVCGAACQPWKATVTFTPVPAEAFAAYSEPDRVKIAWTLETESLGTASTRFAQETRAVATDEQARRRFRRYWRWARFGIVSIRVLMLPAVKRAAERRWSTGLLAETPPAARRKPSFASGTGEAPVFLGWIPSPESGELVLSDGSPAIRYRSEAELIQACDALARRRVAFSVSGLAAPGPSDVMSWWQDQGRIAVSFLRIAWRQPREWELHEILPGAVEWERCSPAELLAEPATPLSGGRRTSEP